MRYTSAKSSAYPTFGAGPLCIVQNQGQEKQNVIADMGRVYRGCYICIAAAAYGSLHNALPGGRHAVRHQPRLQVGNLTLGYLSATVAGNSPPVKIELARLGFPEEHPVN